MKHHALFTAAVFFAGLLAGIAAAPVFQSPEQAAPVNLPPPGPKHANYRPERLAFFRASPATAEVIMLGDSLTEGGDWAEMLPGVRVLNRGIGGDTSADILARLDEVIARKPRMVFLMIGVNDVRSGVSHEKVLENIRQAIHRLGEAHIRTVLQSTLLISPHLKEETNATLLELNRGQRRLARETGIPYLNVNELVTKDAALDPFFTWDGIHLTPPTYLIWGAAVRSEIEAAAKGGR